MNTQPFKPPCKAGGKPCEKRELGCQERCEAFAEYKANIEKWRTKRREAQILNEYTGVSVARAKQSGKQNIKQNGARMPRTILYDAKRREVQNVKRRKPPKVKKNKQGNKQENTEENREEKGK